MVDIERLEERLKAVEQRFQESGYDVEKIVHSQFKKTFRIQPQAETSFGLFTALCIDTVDPWKQNRVRFFSPLFHQKDTPILSLPFATPISSMGGFDDSGLNWVPPAGSTVCIVFENGSREAPYYIGTTWHRNRGGDGEHNWGFHIDEYYQIHEGHRKGYLVGANDGSQVFPPWNTESYNGYDIDSISDFYNNPTAQKLITYPNIYGFKTPQKHMMKMVDGDYKCNHKNKRIEILSSCGNWMIFKDDHLHQFNPSSAQPDCQSESTSCEGESSNSSISSEIGTPYFKSKNELRPYQGPKTPQNNSAALQQTGIQFLSVSGHTFVMDDMVEEPQGNPEWERSTKNFDFGCSNKFLGRSYWLSATGHRIELSDVEDVTGNRGSDNYIRILTATGNKIELNDHTVGQQTAGDQRGITIQSTSNHMIQLLDNENQQVGPERKEGGVPQNKAKKASVKIKTGYGLQITMSDSTSQTETKNQYLQLFAPQTTNTTRGPHIHHFQEIASGPGQVFLRVGGDYIVSTYDNMVEVIGSQENPSNKISNVSNQRLDITKNIHLLDNELLLNISKEIALILAGQDSPSGSTCGPTAWPVLCLTPNGITISDRVYVSASGDAPCASIFQLLPFHECNPYGGCK